MDLESLAAVVSGVGFPVCISLYLLTKFANCIESLTLEIARLSASIDREIDYRREIEHLRKEMESA